MSAARATTAPDTQTPVRRPTLAYSRALANDPRLLAPDNSGELARFWRWVGLAILVPVLIMTVVRAVDAHDRHARATTTVPYSASDDARDARAEALQIAGVGHP
jgi:hypothetical protein